ncbi:DUF1501 domain-containing protein [Schlesneria paludicola]|uniref:DUF1501 domain-containing protein n=1 Tax=Schlesneria paludicola TaxID=360056 RepID=UPI00029A66F4|nr:DUF1501 domain-containing protein [Schlesneria paludicola]
MLSLQSSGVRLCNSLSRREVMRIGGLGACGLSLPQLLGPRSLRATETATNVMIKPSIGKAKSCIVLFLMGGPPQHSTWDPKPEAPKEVRGQIGSIETCVPGVRFGELMPKLAQRADKLALLRAISTNDNAHSSSGYYMLTGRPHAPMNAENVNPGAPNDWPNWGAVLQRLRPPARDLPTSVRLPHHIFNTDGSVWPGQDGGMLGQSADPWLFRCAPASPDYRITEFQLPGDVSLDRLSFRRDLVRAIARPHEMSADAGLLKTFGDQQERAYRVLASAASRGAFDISAESVATRERYGTTQFGQSCLLARRLIEADVRLVQVNWYRGADEPTDKPCWDSHADETNRLKDVLIPPTDDAFSALLDDLSDRGMLDETLVVCMSEFGRSPKMNANGGRDHWGSVFSIALAGGGIQGGTVHGSSDEIGGFPKSGRVGPEDLTATILHCLGFAPETEFHDMQGRPHVISRGQVIQPILA